MHMRRQVVVFIWRSDQEKKPPLAAAVRRPALRPVPRKGTEMTFVVCVTVSVSCAAKVQALRRRLVSMRMGTKRPSFFELSFSFLVLLLLTLAPLFIFSSCTLA